MNQLLQGKTIVFDGDSICQASSEGTHPNCGWAYRIGVKNHMNWYNFGVGGGTLTAELYSSVTGNARHWISRSIDTIHDNFSSLDYLILEGGTNDADLLAESHEKFGTMGPDDFNGNYDDQTFCGAVESLFFKALSYYPSAKIGFIIAPKMGAGDLAIFKNRRSYFMKIIEICKKWGIPYIDLWDGCPLNPRLQVYYDPKLSKEENVAAKKAYVDGQHLTGIGYDVVSSKIEAWIRTL